MNKHDAKLTMYASGCVPDYQNDSPETYQREAENEHRRLDFSLDKVQRHVDAAINHWLQAEIALREVGLITTDPATDSLVLSVIRMLRDRRDALQHAHDETITDINIIRTEARTLQRVSIYANLTPTPYEMEADDLESLPF